MALQTVSLSFIDSDEVLLTRPQHRGITSSMPFPMSSVSSTISSVSSPISSVSSPISSVSSLICMYLRMHVCINILEHSTISVAITAQELNSAVAVAGRVYRISFVSSPISSASSLMSMSPGGDFNRCRLDWRASSSSSARAYRPAESHPSGGQISGGDGRSLVYHCPSTRYLDRH